MLVCVWIYVCVYAGLGGIIWLLGVCMCVCFDIDVSICFIVCVAFLYSMYMVVFPLCGYVF